MKTTCAILRLFLDNPTALFSGVEVARKTGTHERNCYRHLQQLAEEGIVVREARTYRFNARLAEKIFREIKFMPRG